ncbi:unnamed protein product [Adineta steineri]|uniref:Uncharacterized protein n=1 Tax=Adineta steineri TaxID=433720 RepID=A0A815QYC9_9BILA|nr:unnamed protein product [Adineta steineri]
MKFPVLGDSRVGHMPSNSTTSSYTLIIKSVSVRRNIPNFLPTNIFIVPLQVNTAKSSIESLLKLNRATDVG